MVKSQFNSSVTIKTCNSSEFVSVECYKLFTNLGNIHQRTCIHTHQKNGIAERKHKLEIARALKFQGTYLQEFGVIVFLVLPTSLKGFLHLYCMVSLPMKPFTK